MTGARLRGRTRFRLAVGLGASGLLLAVGVGSALAVGATTTMHQYDADFGSALAASTAIAEAPAPSAAATPAPALSAAPAASAEPPRAGGTTAERTMPTLAPDGHRYDQWGVRLYDKNDTAEDITYPASIVGDELTNARTWVDTQLLTASCMADAGHDFYFKLWWERSPKDPGAASITPEDTEAWTALYGPNAKSAGPYDWTEAGCDGWAVHTMGNDHAN